MIHPNPNREKMTILASGGHLQKKIQSADVAITKRRKKQYFFPPSVLIHAITSREPIAKNVPILFPDSPNRTVMAKTIAIIQKRFLPNHALILSIILIYDPPPN
ncbi:MAG: hypothetical protein WCX74_03195 [Candidatus Paceibacterota bacterium]